MQKRKETLRISIKDTTNGLWFTKEDLQSVLTKSLERYDETFEVFIE